MSAPSDALLTKTDAELRFFVENPQFYQPELVNAARRELRRRGASTQAPGPAASAAPPAGPVPAPAGLPPTPTGEYAAADLDEPAARRPWLVPLLVLLAVTVAGLGAYGWRAGTRRQAAQVAAARTAAHLSPDSLKLETVATSAMPDYDIEPIVAKQLATIPAAEKQPEQSLRQFRAMCRRFWAAETQSEFLTKQAYGNQPGPTFASQALLVREAWRAWNKGAVYTFKFGPTMRAQYELMGQVASSQQHILARLPELLPAQAFRTDRELNARDADVQAWMAGLRRVSPVTGKPYRVVVLNANDFAR